MRGFMKVPFAAIAIAALAATTGAMGVSAANRTPAPVAAARAITSATSDGASLRTARTAPVSNPFAGQHASHGSTAAKPVSATNPELPVHPRDVASGYTASNVSMERTVATRDVANARAPMTRSAGGAVPSAAATVSGTVYDSSTNPVAGTWVQAYTIGATGWLGDGQVTTDSSGAWSISVPTGSITIMVGGTASLVGGYYGPGGFAFKPDDATAVTVGAGGVTGLAVHLPGIRTISGRITDAGGNGHAGLSVTIHPIDREAWTITTDTNGGYSFTPWLPGTYAISVSDSGNTYASGWYTASGFTADPGQATRLTFDGFSNVTLATIAVPTTHLVSGKAVNASGTGPSDVEVDAYVHGSFYAWTTTGSGGTFSMRLGPADYTLYFYDWSAGTAPGWYSSTGLVTDPTFAGTFTVASIDRVGLNVSLPLARHIKGKIFYGASPLPQIDVTADSNETWHSFAQTSSDGSYSVPVPAGNYVIYVSSIQYSNGYLASSGLTTDPTAAQVVSVSAADVTVRNLGLAGLVNIDGNVTSAVNQGEVDGVYVEFFVAGDFYTEFQTVSPTAYFSLGLPAGSYEIAFVDPSGKYATGWYSSGGFVRSFANATEVTVAPPLTTGLRIALPLQTAPGAPTAVSAIPFHASAAIGWTPPANDGYRPITRYTVTASPSGKTCTATDRVTCTIAGLTDGTPYSFTVKATNAKGTSAASSPSAAVTPLGVPGAPTGLKVTRGTASMTIGWTAPAANGGAISSYTVTSTPASAGCTATTTTSCKVSGLSNGTWYTFSVTARNAIGPGPAANTTAMQPNTPEIRYGGVDAFATAAAVSAHSFPANCGCTAYVAFVGNFPDALGGAAAAGSVNGPVLFANTTGFLSSATVTELNRLEPNRIVVLGGSGVIADPVFHALEWYAPEVDRLFGAGRFDTAAAISRATFAANCGCTAYIAYAYNFPDALGGAAASGKVKGPVLLVDSAGPINPATSTELTRLKPARIVVLGGTGVVPDAIYNVLKTYAPSITRYYGPSRYDTAASISSHTFASSCGCVAYVALGTDFNGALAGAAAAGRVGGPLLLVSNALPIPAATVTELKRLKPTQIVVLGGTAQIPDAIYKALAAYAPAS